MTPPPPETTPGWDTELLSGRLREAAAGGYAAARPAQPASAGPAPGYGRQRAVPPPPGALAPPADLPPADLPSADVMPAGTRQRRAARRLLFGALLVLGLGGLTLAAVHVAVQVLPRQFTPAQQRSIATWQMLRRWRTEPAGKIFPATVSYQLPAALMNSADGLPLQARLLGVSPQTTCSAAVAKAAAPALAGRGCQAALRATYADSSGALLATVAVVVLPDSTASAASAQLQASSGQVQMGGFSGAPVAPARFVQPLPVAGSLAATFGKAQEQLSVPAADGPYLVLATAGFAGGRSGALNSGDDYVVQEMASLAEGLVNAEVDALGPPPAAPSCPGTPGC